MEGNQDSVEYNYKAMAYGIVPAVGVLVLFFLKVTGFARWALLVGAMALCAVIVYTQSKKKHNIYTAAVVVAFVGVLIHLAKRLSFL